MAPSMRQLKLTARVITGRPATVTGRAPMWRHAQSDSEAGGPPGHPARPGGGSSAVARWACPPGRQLAQAPENAGPGPGPGPSDVTSQVGLLGCSHDGQPGRARPDAGPLPVPSFETGAAEEPRLRCQVGCGHLCLTSRLPGWLWPSMLALPGWLWPSMLDVARLAVAIYA